MSLIEEKFTQEEIESFAGMDLIIYHCGSFNTVKPTPDTYNDDWKPCFSLNTSGISVSVGGVGSDYYVMTQLTRDTTLSRYSKQNKRMCGLIVGENDDGSFEIQLLGDNINFNLSPSQVTRTFNIAYFNTGLKTKQSTDPTGTFPVTLYCVPSIEDLSTYSWTSESSIPRGIHGKAEYYTPAYHIIQETQCFSFKPSWYSGGFGTPDLMWLDTLYDGVEFSGGQVVLTKDPDKTLTIGHGHDAYFYPSENLLFSTGAKNIGGDLFDINGNFLRKFSSIVQNRVVGQSGYDITPEEIGYTSYAESSPDNTNRQLPTGCFLTAYGKYAFDWIPFNLVLTRNRQQAINYIDTGKLPDDAFIYPLDPDNIPTNDSGADDTVNPDSTDNDGIPRPEDGRGKDDTDPMPSANPIASSQSLTNNNLYWLTGGQLKDFITWFWHGATDVDDWNEILQKIQGLYENLSEALISVRYMPMKSEWFGGVTITDHMNIAQLNFVSTIQEINKKVAPYRNVGSFKVNEYYRTFADYSPYTDVSLYLPCYGLVDLDVNMVMKHTISVQVCYDIMSGTIQYIVRRGTYNDGQIIFTTMAKMCVEIPISLQAKAERDNAVYNNVSQIVAGATGVVASSALKSPMGVVMSSNSIIESQIQGAGMTVKGNAGEMGAFYMPSKIAIYIKRPKYNRDPSSYGKHVGYPCYKQHTLAKGDGFSVFEKPHITFHPVTVSGQDKTILPLDSEVEKIYQFLEKGVIL